MAQLAPADILAQWRDWRVGALPIRCPRCPKGHSSRGSARRCRPRPWPPRLAGDLGTWSRCRRSALGCNGNRPTGSSPSRTRVRTRNFAYMVSNSRTAVGRVPSNSPHRRGGCGSGGQTMRRTRCAAVRSTSHAHHPAPGAEDLALGSPVPTLAPGCRSRSVSPAAGGKRPHNRIR